MKYYDKMGDTHNTMAAAMGANMMNRFRGTMIGSKVGSSVRKAEARLEDMMKKQEPLSDAEIDAVVDNIMTFIQTPISDIQEGKVNSDLGAEMFFKALVTNILYSSMHTSLEDIASIAKKLAPKLAAEVSIMGVSKSE